MMPGLSYAADPGFCFKFLGSYGIESVNHLCPEAPWTWRFSGCLFSREPKKGKRGSRCRDRVLLFREKRAHYHTGGASSSCHIAHEAMPSSNHQGVLSISHQVLFPCNRDDGTE